jgi:integrase
LALRNLAEKLTDKPNLTSHSFRAGFITQLWRDTNDIEFVRQAIGHIKVESTSSYVENLSDEERRLRMEQINNPEDLII